MRLERVAFKPLRSSTAVARNPIEKLVDDGDECRIDNLHAVGLPHQRVETLHGGFFIATQIVSLSMDGNTPDLAVFAIPRLRLASHKKTLQQLRMKLTGKPKGLLRGLGEWLFAEAPFLYGPGTKRVGILYPILYPAILAGYELDKEFCTRSRISDVNRSTPGRTRTSNPWFRRPVLYPIELRTQIGMQTV